MFNVPEPWLRAGEGPPPEIIVRSSEEHVVSYNNRRSRAPQEGSDMKGRNGNGYRLSSLINYLVFKWMEGIRREKDRIWQTFKVVFQDFEAFTETRGTAPPAEPGSEQIPIAEAELMTALSDVRKASLTINLPFERRVGLDRRKEKQNLTAEIQFAGIPEDIIGEVVQQDDGHLIVRIEQEHLRKLADLKIRLPGCREITASLIDLVSRSNTCIENGIYHEFDLELPREFAESFKRDEGRFIRKKRRIREREIEEETEIKG